METINLTDIIDDIFLNCSGDTTKFQAKELAKQCALEFGKQLLELAAEDAKIKNESVIGNTPSGDSGMSKRFYATCAAMQGLLTNEIYMSYMAKEYREKTNKAVIEDAYEIADELLKQELL